MPATRCWTLVFLKDGKPAERVPLKEGTTHLGRDADCDIVLPDSSVSRRHASIEAAEGVTIRDQDSRNGVRVNGVPRKQAALQPGDRIDIGIFALRLDPGSASPRPGPAQALRAAPSAEAHIEQTAAQNPRLPEVRSERHLASLYHVCFWLVEESEPALFEERCLGVLKDGLGAADAQLYDAAGKLVRRTGPPGKKASIELAEFLAGRCQRMPEALAIPGADIARHQRRAGDYNYLVGPIRPAGAPPGPCPFLVLLRPTEWEDFQPDDRVMLQAVCQLWARQSRRAEQVAALKTENATLKAAAPGASTLLGDSPAMQSLRAAAAKAAKTQATVLIRGETGSGKEVAAHFIHAQSTRAAGPFVKVNCAAIPEGLIESELFGHVRGAFTDAKADRRGRFEQADGGTLFLDEIGEMPLAVQSKVLRALESREIERLGAETPVRVDVRLVAATHRDLKRLVEAGAFREDLYYRLNVLAVAVPPLRDHPDDIPALAAHFLDAFCRENGLAALTLPPDALAALREHPWPGNARELRNVIQRCAIHCTGTSIAPDLVREQIRSL